MFFDAFTLLKEQIRAVYMVYRSLFNQLSGLS